MQLDTARAMKRIHELCDCGPRIIGSDGHRRAEALIKQWFASADSIQDHFFREHLFGREVTCRNFWRTYTNTPRLGRILLGTHYDTRPFADQDPDPKKRKCPVPGANDGASGVAILAELATHLQEAEVEHLPTVDIVLFDAEDLHGIDGKSVSIGARRFVEDLPRELEWQAVLIVDMVAGKDLIMNYDLGCRRHEPSYALTERVFSIGRSLQLNAFLRTKLRQKDHFTCDHRPFQCAGYPTALLLDIDHSGLWHTTHDTPESCSEASIGQMATLLKSLLVELLVPSRESQNLETINI